MSADPLETWRLRPGDHGPRGSRRRTIGGKEEAPSVDPPGGSAPSAHGSGTRGSTVKAWVKADLQTLVLAYLIEEPRTGRELINDVQRDMGVRLSPARVYPLLHLLVKEGILTAVRGARQVVYGPADHRRARDLLRQRQEAHREVLGFIESIGSKNDGPRRSQAGEGPET